MPLLPAAESSPQVDYIDAGDRSVAFWHPARHPEILGYRGRPGGNEVERYWNPAKPPCVPSDLRPQHLFTALVAAEAAAAAERVEQYWPGDPDDEYDMGGGPPYDEACIKYKHALACLLELFPEVAPCPMYAHASQHDTRPCPCGRGVLAKWPWVVQTAQLGFCDCYMTGWERNCWRCEWFKGAGARHL